MKKLILFIFPLFFFANAFAIGGETFQKRKYRDGAFKESVKQIAVKTGKKIHDGTKWAVNKVKGIGEEKASGAYYSGDFIGAYILIGLGVSVVVASIYVAAATNPVSWGLAFLYCLGAWFGCGCCCHKHW